MANDLNTINGVTASAVTSTAATKTAGGSLDKQAFLKLLVTQMQYQDPLDPQDNAEYVAQLAQFSSLEQMTNVSKAMDTLSGTVSGINESVLVGQLSSMIGQKLQWTTTETVKDADGNAVTDANGKAQTTKTTYEGTVTGVSISDGSPSVIAKDTDGTTHKVVISDITRVGDGSTNSTAAS